MQVSIVAEDYHRSQCRPFFHIGIANEDFNKCDSDLIVPGKLVPLISNKSHCS